MNWLQHLRYYGGIGLIVFGIVLTFGGVVELNEGKETLASFLSIVFFVGVLPIITGIWMVYTAQKNLKERKYLEAEQQILQLAMQLGGKITVTEVTTNIALSPTEADSILNTMQLKGFFTLKVSSRGVIVYEVAGMLHQDDTLLDV